MSISAQPLSPWRVVFYLYAYRKQSQKTPPQELAFAERRLAEVLTGGIEDGR